MIQSTVASLSLSSVQSLEYSLYLLLKTYSTNAMSYVLNSKLKLGAVYLLNAWNKICKIEHFIHMHD